MKKKIGNCPYCLGESILFALAFFLIHIIVSFSKSLFFIKKIAFFLSCLFLIWSFIHLFYFAKNYSKVLSHLSLPKKYLVKQVVKKSLFHYIHSSILALNKLKFFIKSAVSSVVQKDV